jgi:hypothetical protein
LSIGRQADGILEWDTRLGGPYPDGCLGITQTTDRNYVLSGQSSQTRNALEDISLFKIDNRGNEIWRRYYGGSYFDTGTVLFNVLMEDISSLVNSQEILMIQTRLSLKPILMGMKNGKKFLEERCLMGFYRCVKQLITVLSS